MDQQIAHQKGTSGLFSYVEQFGKVISSLTAALLLVSVFYDLNYLYALNIDFNQVPTTIGDHARSAIIWGPMLIWSIVLVIAMEFFIRLMTGAVEDTVQLTENKKAFPATRGFRRPLHRSLRTTSRKPRTDGQGAAAVAASETTFRRIFRAVRRIFGPYVAMLLFFAGVRVVQESLATEYIYLLFLILWLTATSVHFRRPHVATRLKQAGGSLAAPAITYIPFLIAGMGLYGYGQGTKLLEDRTIRWGIAIRTEKSVEFCTLSGLRRFTNAVITVESSGRIGIYPADRVLATISMKGKDVSHQPCPHFD